MSCKTPVLMAIDGVSRELVEEAKCGIYIEPENIEEFNKHIRAYINDGERLKREGNNGYDYAKKHFDRDVLAKKYLEEIKTKVISQKDLRI
jgi:glycosyltransferase involved in cell wall biosynthesis